MLKNMDKTRIHFVRIFLMVFAVNQNVAAQDRITGKPFVIRSEIIACNGMTAGYLEESMNLESASPQIWEWEFRIGSSPEAFAHLQT
jgi:hypothetical protein